VFLSALFSLSSPSYGQQGGVDVGRGFVGVFEPTGYDGTQPTPLLLLLHAFDSDGQSQENYFQLASLADQYGMLYAYPNGTIDPQNGTRFWHATDASCAYAGSTVDDSGYLRALIDSIIANYNVDLQRVYIVGHSNGGFMAYRMACDHADVVTAIVSVAGATYHNLNDCTPSHPVHVLQIHGTADTNVQYNGANIPVPYPGARATVTRWQVYNGCNASLYTSAYMDLDAAVPGPESQVEGFRSACGAGGSAELWTIHGGTHFPVLTQEFRQGIFDFLLSHPRPEPVVSYCTGKTNSLGAVPFITASGVASAATFNDWPFRITGNNLVPGEFGFLMYSFSKGDLNYHGGKLCLKTADLEKLFPIKQADSQGILFRNFNNSIASGVNPMFTVGQKVCAQWYQKDPNNPLSFPDTLSDAIRFVIAP
jgi:polyhydroxybutyrate depolymerase